MFFDLRMDCSHCRIAHCKQRGLCTAKGRFPPMAVVRWRSGEQPEAPTYSGLARSAYCPWGSRAALGPDVMAEDSHTIAATTLGGRRPENIHLATEVLGHADLRSRDYYICASGLIASRRSHASEDRQLREVRGQTKYRPRERPTTCGVQSIAQPPGRETSGGRERPPTQSGSASDLTFGHSVGAQWAKKAAVAGQFGNDRFRPVRGHLKAPEDAPREGHPWARKSSWAALGQLLGQKASRIDVSNPSRGK